MNKEILRLMAGFRRFKGKYFSEDSSEHSIYHRLASVGQSPKTLLIGCSDSRVDPAILTNASPGELFVIRNVAALVPPCEEHGVGLHGTSSALEFAVKSLKVENIIVFGHRQCGGIRALMQGATEQSEGFIGRWMCIADEARKKVNAENPDADDETKWRIAEKEAVKVSLKNLRTFPFVADAIRDRQMNLIGLYFDLEQGELWECDDEHSEFRRLDV